MQRRLNRYLPSVVSALICMALYLASFSALLWFVVTQLWKTWPSLLDAALGGIDNATKWAESHGITVPSDMFDQLESQLRDRAGEVAAGVGNVALAGVGMASSLVMILVMAMFLTFFSLIGGKSLWATMSSAVPNGARPAADRAFRASLHTARAWMFASTVTGLVDGLFIGLGLHLLGIPLALPIGVLTFIAGYIPMVGATLAGAVAVVVSLFFGGPVAAIWALVIVLAVQQIEGNVLSPLLLSRAMNFSPVITLLLATAGGTAFGIAGLFLAVPLTGIITAAVKAWRREPLSQQP